MPALARSLAHHHALLLPQITTPLSHKQTSLAKSTYASPLVTTCLNIDYSYPASPSTTSHQPPSRSSTRATTASLLTRDTTFHNTTFKRTHNAIVCSHHRGAPARCRLGRCHLLDLDLDNHSDPLHHPSAGQHFDSLHFIRRQHHFALLPPHRRQQLVVQRLCHCAHNHQQPASAYHARQRCRCPPRRPRRRRRYCRHGCRSPVVNRTLLLATSTHRMNMRCESILLVSEGDPFDTIISWHLHETSKNLLLRTCNDLRLASRHCDDNVKHGPCPTSPCASSLANLATSLHSTRAQQHFFLSTWPSWSCTGIFFLQGLGDFCIQD